MSTLMYQEPMLAILVLDFLKESETRRCLESVRAHVKVPHKVVYLHNGPADYPAQLLREGLVDQLVQTKVNTGLGLGTRDLFAASQSYWSLYLQNDQFFARDLTEAEFTAMTGWMGGRNARGKTVYSISLAGAPGGDGVYSERAHLIQTKMYRNWEEQLHLGPYGAGPYHDGEWREATIQRHYHLTHGTHFIWPHAFVQDNGHRAIRQNPDGSIWEHRPDTKQARLVSGPVTARHVYPKFTEEEWGAVLATQSWPEWQIPEMEKGESFHVWN